MLVGVMGDGVLQLKVLNGLIQSDLSFLKILLHIMCYLYSIIWILVKIVNHDGLVVTKKNIPSPSKTYQFSKDVKTV